MSAVKLISGLFLVVASSAFASQPQGSGEPPASSGASVTQGRLSGSELNHAKQWNLSTEEYEKFKEILKSPRAYFTPNLEKNPLLALALESESAIDRKKYADRWVQMQYENNVKVIAWQLEVSEAWQRQYPGIPKLSYKNPETSQFAISNQSNAAMSPVANGRQPFSFPTADKPRAQLFIAIDGCAECPVAYRRQYEALQSGKISGVDVHFVGSPNKQQIVDWAVAQKLDAADVNERRVITLNVADKDVPRLPIVEFN